MPKISRTSLKITNLQILPIVQEMTTTLEWFVNNYFTYKAAEYLELEPVTYP